MDMKIVQAIRDVLRIDFYRGAEFNKLSNQMIVKIHYKKYYPNFTA